MSKPKPRPEPVRIAPPTRAQVREAVQRVGFPFEGRVLEILIKHGYHAVPSWAFPDPNTTTSREIDLVATKYFSFPEDAKAPDELPTGVTVHLIVECKKTLSMVLFDIEPREVLTNEHDFRMAYLGDPEVLWTRGSAEGWPQTGATGEPMEVHVGLGTDVWPWPSHVGVHQCFLAPQNKKEPGQGFSASDDDYSRLNGMLHGTWVYRDSQLSPSRASGVRPGILIPLLLVDGDVWASRASRRTRLKKISHGSLVTTYWGKFYAQFRIDVLTPRALPGFLTSLDSQMAALAARLAAEREALARASILDGKMRQRPGGR